MTIHIGSDFDDFLASEDLAEEVSAEIGRAHV